MTPSVPPGLARRVQRLAAVACWLAIPAEVMAQSLPFVEQRPAAYWVDGSGNLIRTAYNECIRTGYWTPALAIAECDPDLVPKPPPPPTATYVPPPAAAAPPRPPSPVAPAYVPELRPPKKNRDGPPDSPGKHAQVAATVSVFYGTTRQPLKGDRKKFYSNEANKVSGEITRGIAYVSIPPNHKKGRLEEKSLITFWARPDPQSEVVLDDAPSFPKDIFDKRLYETVQASKEKQVLIFVHGFNNSFSESARRAGQLAFDLEMRMTPVLYSWPSSEKTMGYVADAQLAGLEGERFAEFIADVVVASKATTFNVIAHSMGNYVLASALGFLPEMLAKRQYKLDGDKLPFSNIVMAAPDLQRSIFSNFMVPKLKKSGARVSIYHSYADLAMYASLLTHQEKAVGGAGPLDPESWLDSINATRQSIEGLGLYHSYFAGWPVLRDLRQLFGGKPVDERSFLCKICTASGTYWRLVKEKSCRPVSTCR